MSKRTTGARSISGRQKQTTLSSTVKKKSVGRDSFTDVIIPATPTPKKKSYKDDSPDEIAETGKKEVKVKRTGSERSKTVKGLHFGHSKSTPELKKNKSIKNKINSDTDNNDPEEEAKTYIEDLYQAVDIKFVETKPRSNGRNYIFKHLDPTFWPILPMGYKWFYDSSDSSQLPTVKKCSESDEKDIEITIFGPNGNTGEPKKRVNYVTWFDNLNVQCYANTRLPTFCDGAPRNDDYPISTEDYKSGVVCYDRGHGIDYADTIHQTKHFSLSHHRNFIPEPRIWNRTLRRTWVGRIRKEEGAYMQRVYYHKYSLYHLASTPTLTNNGTPIPVGAYFSQINGDRTTILKATDISWDYQFHKLPKAKKSTKLSKLDIAWPIFSILPQSMPMALVYATDMTCQRLDEILQKYDDMVALERPPLNGGQKKARYDRYMFEQLYQAAETEYLNVTYKLDFASWCVDAGLNSEAKLYLKRAKKHAEKLEDLEIKFEISKSHFSLFREYGKKVSTIFTQDQEDYWKDFTP